MKFGKAKIKPSAHYYFHVMSTLNSIPKVHSKYTAFENIVAKIREEKMLVISIHSFSYKCPLHSKRHNPLPHKPIAGSSNSAANNDMIS